MWGGALSSWIEDAGLLAAYFSLARFSLVGPEYLESISKTKVLFHADTPAVRQTRSSLWAYHLFWKTVSVFELLDKKLSCSTLALGGVPPNGSNLVGAFLPLLFSGWENYSWGLVGSGKRLRGLSSSVSSGICHLNSRYLRHPSWSIKPGHGTS